MARQYAPRAFLRHVPTPLLRRFFERERIPLALAWDPEPDVEAVYDAWQGLSADNQVRAEQMFRAVHDLADPVTARTLAAEAAFQGYDLSALPADYGPHATALWVLLTYPTTFHQVLRLRQADHLPGRYWHRVPGLPTRPPDASAAARHRLGLEIAGFYRAAQGRGHRVTPEHYRRANGEHYFFCYPDDYTHTLVGHDERGTLRRTAVRPAFEVVFVFDPAAGALETFVRDAKWVRQRLEEMFCETILDTLPPVENPRRPPYELDVLLDRSAPLATDPADGVRDVRVRKLRVSLPGTRRRAVLEANPDGPPSDVYDFLEEAFPPDRYPRHELHVTQATFALTYPGPDGADRVLTFEVSYPNSCSLKSKTDDQRALGEKCLRRWGIARD